MRVIVGRLLGSASLAVTLGLAACACKPRAGGAAIGGDGGGGGAGGGGGDPAACAELAPTVRALYQAEAGPDGLTAEEVADNTELVLAECREAPARVAACARAATGVAQLERDCLAPLDDEGSEGRRFGAAAGAGR
ncbi:MAG: hypothetical protein HS111_35835 [Kofleriaceae bacterium]|nr:hypothetical protein [Kofleriaceae bacterium]MCL4228412.1 hypothetical protein [Myxococcales bacterium]